MWRPLARRSATRRRAHKQHRRRATSGSSCSTRATSRAISTGGPRAIKFDCKFLVLCTSKCNVLNIVTFYLIHLRRHLGEKLDRKYSVVTKEGREQDRRCGTRCSAHLSCERLSSNVLDRARTGRSQASQFVRVLALPANDLTSAARRFFFRLAPAPRSADVVPSSFRTYPRRRCVLRTPPAFPRASSRRGRGAHTACATCRRA